MSDGEKNKMLRKITKPFGVLCVTTVLVISAITLHLSGEKNHPTPSHRNLQALSHLQSLIASNAVNVRRVQSLSGNRSDPETLSEHDLKDTLTSDDRAGFLESPDIDHGHSHHLNVPETSFDQPQRQKSDSETSLDQPQKQKSDSETLLDQPQKQKSDSETSLGQPQKQKSDSETSLDQPQKQKSDSETSFFHPQKQKSDSETSLDQSQKRKSDSETSLDQSQKRKSDSETLLDQPQKQKSDSETSFDQPQKQKSDSETSFDQPQKQRSGSETSLDQPQKQKSDSETSFDQPQKQRSDSETSLDQPQKQNPDLEETPGGLRDKVNVSETQDDHPDNNLKPKEDPQQAEFQALHRQMGIGGKAVLRQQEERSGKPPRIVRTQSGEQRVEGMFYTHDDWPQFSFPLYNKSIPKTPYDPPHSIQWDFNVTAFLQRPDVQGRPPKLITWMAPMGYLPSLPEPVRLRTCPDMPCRMTTNKAFSKQSAALIWNGQKMRAERPPERTHPDQVFVFHNQERPEPQVMAQSTYRHEAWRSAFNWTMSFRFDSDILDFYGYLSKRPVPVVKNYTAILAAKTNMAAWLVSHCSTHSRREQYAKLLEKFVPVHIYGGCGKYKCARNKDDDCFQTIQSKYKFLLAFENGICQDYITEKFFRYLEADLVLVARGGQGYEKHAPRGTFINAADFKSVQDLANHLVYLDQHPEEYLKILRAKDQYVPMYEEYPHRNKQGSISFMHYHYEAVAYCELCRRLWNLNAHRKTYPDLRQWFDKGNCVKPADLH